MKVIISISIVLVIVIISAVLIFLYMMKQPLYKPGMIREGRNLRSSLTPPKQTDNSDFWQVEKDIRLYHYSVGKGRNLLVIHGGPGSPFIEPWKDLDPLTDDNRLHYYDQRGCGKSTRPINKFKSSNYYQNMKEFFSLKLFISFFFLLQGLGDLLFSSQIILDAYLYNFFIQFS